MVLYDLIILLICQASSLNLKARPNIILTNIIAMDVFIGLILGRYMIEMQFAFSSAVILFAIKDCFYLFICHLCDIQIKACRRVKQIYIFAIIIHILLYFEIINQFYSKPLYICIFCTLALMQLFFINKLYPPNESYNYAK